MSHATTSIEYLAIIGCLLLDACGDGDSGDDEVTPMGSHEELCVVAAPDGVAAMGGAFSLAFDEGRYWIFGETILGSEEEGYVFLSSSGAVTDVDNLPCGMVWDLVTDDEGAVAQLLTLTEEEMTHDAEHPEEGRTVLWPQSGFVHEGTGYIW